MEDTAGCRITTVDSTQIIIVADKGRIRGLAGHRIAEIFRAGVSVRRVDSLVFAAVHNMAAVNGAGVFVITGDDIVQTFSGFAITGIVGTGITIITGKWLMCA